MKHLRDIALAFTAIMCGSSTAATAEKWSCDMETRNDQPLHLPYKQEWIVSDDEMFVGGSPVHFRVVLNNKDTLFAFARFFKRSESFPGGSTTVGNLSVMITKRTGVVTEIDEIFGFDEGMQTKQWFPPTIDSGHCSLEQP
jgi:hypothetical protein